jgi:hypothetical protein
LDPDSGEVYQAKATQDSDGQWVIKTSLPALGSRLFVVGKKVGQVTAKPRPQLSQVREKSLAAERWEIALSEPNVLVLDRARYRIDAGDWQEATEILRIDQQVHAALGIAPRGGQMVQPWAREHKANPKRTQVELNYAFDVQALPSGECFLALEQPQTFGVCVNGAPVNMDAECGWWCDKSLRRVPIDAGMLREGRNEIAMCCDYSEDHPGLECAYLLGSFGVKLKGVVMALTAPPETLKLGDWTGQGLPFYSGSVSYCTRIQPRLQGDERVFIRVPEYRGAAVRILIAGQEVGVIAWEPNELDITEAVAAVGGKSCEVRIEVLGHRRNSHGPLHCAEKWPHWTGPGQYITSGDGWIDGYNLVPCGLMAAPRLEVRR